jgi:tetratricopeptide (TPR) repeat protein
MLGNIYFQVVLRKRTISVSFLLKNMGFLIKNLPLAKRKAEFHFQKAIQGATEIGAIGIEGLSYLNLGLLYKIKGIKKEAKECLGTAIKLFERCEATIYLQQAKEALASLE